MTADLIAAADAERRRLDRMDEGFTRPRFHRRDVADVLEVSYLLFQNWHVRGQIELDADEDRGTGWRLYSAVDVLRLGLAVQLTRAGLPASLLKDTLARIEALFPLDVHNLHLASNRRATVMVTTAGEVTGPVIGNALDLDEAPADAAIILRIDALIRRTLERLG